MHRAASLAEKLRDAVVDGHADRFRKLLRGAQAAPGGSVAVQNYDTASGWSSLHYAARHNHAAVAALLLDLGHEDGGVARDVNLNTPLMVACQYGSMDVFALLVRRCPQSVHLVNLDQWTCLHFCARHSRVEMMLMLLDSGGAHVDALDKDGCTPLHHACAYGFLRGIEVLIEAGANHNVRNKQGWTPRDWVFSYKHDAALQETVRKHHDRQQHGGAPLAGAGKWPSSRALTAEGY